MLSQKTSSDVGKLYNQGREQVHHFELKPSLGKYIGIRCFDLTEFEKKKKKKKKIFLD